MEALTGDDLIKYSRDKGELDALDAAYRAYDMTDAEAWKRGTSTTPVASLSASRKVLGD